MTPPILAGAGAFKELLARLHNISDETCPDLYDQGADGDSRDYVTMAEVTRESVERNLHHEDAAHREGYLRALTSLLCLVGDGCGPDANWEPILETGPSFAAADAAARLLKAHRD